MTRESFVVGYLSGGHTTTEFTASLAAAVNFTNQLAMQYDDAPIQVGTLPLKSGPRISAARNMIAKRFLNIGADWLFMVDDDMEFPPDAIHHLLEAADPVERPIVGGLAIAGGRDGWFPNLFRLSGTPEEPVMERLDGWPPDQLVQVDATGAACLLVHRSVFEKIATEYGEPWVWFQETKMGERAVGEDITFCLRARGVGFPVYVHTGVSFGHMKMVNVDPDFYADWVDAHRFIITGTGRCGTGYMATLLSAIGISCGHEETFNPLRDPQWGWKRGDASWLAAPHLEHFKGHVVHLVRHPLQVIGSLLGIGFFDDELSDKHGPWRDYADTYMVWQGVTEIKKAMAFVVEWNTRIESHADQTIRVEDVNGEDLAQIARAAGANHAPADFAAALAGVPKDVNHRNHQDITWDDLPDGTLKDELRSQAERYGYTTDTSPDRTT